MLQKDSCLVLVFCVAELRLTSCLRVQGQAAVPSFDHGVGDPVDGDIEVKPE